MNFSGAQKSPVHMLANRALRMNRLGSIVVAGALACQLVIGQAMLRFRCLLAQNKQRLAIAIWPVQGVIHDAVAVDVTGEVE